MRETPADAKRSQRQRLIEQRFALDVADHRAQSASLCEQIIASDDFAARRRIMGFVPYRGEVDIMPILHHTLAQADKILCLPRIEKDAGGGQRLVCCDVGDLSADLVDGYRGIREPAAHCHPVSYNEIDYIIVPCVACDKMGTRLGYGGGFYDRLLAMLPDDVFRICPILSCQLTERIIGGEPHDVRVPVLLPLV